MQTEASRAFRVGQAPVTVRIVSNADVASAQGRPQILPASTQARPVAVLTVQRQLASSDGPIARTP